MSPARCLALAGLVALAGCAQGKAAAEASDIAQGRMPADYRDWRVIAVGHEVGKLDDLRAVLGNDVAYRAARDGKLPYPDGAIIGRIAWDYAPMAESAQAFGQPQSFVSGAPKEGVQFMVRDSRKFAATGGWQFTQFTDGRPAAEASAKPCFTCHDIVRGRDFVFNRYAR